MGAGRPSKFDEKFINEVYEYTDSCVDDSINIGTEEKPFYKTKVKLPTIAGLAIHLKVNKTTLYEWEKNEEFSNALDYLRQKQEETLLNNGLSGDYNSTIAKLVLSSNHKYSEKQDIDHTTKGDKINSVEELTTEELIKRAEAVKTLKES